MHIYEAEQKRKLSIKDFKLIALDIDGTLLNSKYELTKRTRKALKSAMDLGLKVTIATGRYYPSARRIARSIPINAPIIVNDGALIKDVFTNKTIFEKPLPLEMAQEILELTTYFPSFKVQVFMKETKIYVGINNQIMQFSRLLNFCRKHPIKSSINFLRDFIFIPVQNVSNIAEAKRMLKQDPCKIVVYGDDGELKTFKSELIKRYEERVFLTSAIPRCVDVLNGEISKAKGLVVLADLLGIKHEEIIAVGDNFNDMEMLKFAGLGVAMGNAPDLVKRVADIVTASNDQDGVAKLIEMMSF